MPSKPSSTQLFTTVSRPTYRPGVGGIEQRTSSRSRGGRAGASGASRGGGGGGRCRAEHFVPRQGGERGDVRGHAGVGVAASQLARPGVLLAAGPVLPLG